MSSDKELNGTHSGHSGHTGAVLPTDNSTPQTDRPSAKRALSPDTNSPTNSIENMDMESTIPDTITFPDAPPEGVHHNMWKMLKSIYKEASKVSHIENRLEIIDEMLDNDGAQIAVVKDRLERLEASNKTLVGRLLRAEAVISRQQTEITDLRTRSMRDNIIIKTSGAKYKEIREENTNGTIKKFLNDELHIADTDTIRINSSHRMGQASGGYNRMLIARLPKREDHKKIFDNASSLKGTNYSISKQIPAEVDERRQFAWADFKQAKAEKKPVRFDGATLVINGDPITKYEPDNLPTSGNTLLGLSKSTLPRGASEVTIEGDHQFQAWAVPARCISDVREGLDQLLQLPELSGATYMPYAYRFDDGRGSYENFHSDGDINSGLSMVRILRELSAKNIAVAVAHHAMGRPLTRRKKMECLASAIGGAVMALSAVVTP